MPSLLHLRVFHSGFYWWGLVVLGVGLGGGVRWLAHERSPSGEEEIVRIAQVPQEEVALPGVPLQELPPIARPALEEMLATASALRPPLLVPYLATASAGELQELLDWYVEMGSDEFYGHTAFLFLRWLELDASGALAAARAAQDRNVLGQCLQVWMEKDAVAALEALTPEERGRFLQQLVRNLQGYDGKTAARLYLDASFGKWHVTEEMLEAILTHFPERLPELAEAAARDRPGAFAAAWARRDPEASLAWAKAIPSYQKRHEALEAIYRTVYADDREGLMRVVAQLPEGNLRTRLTSTLAKQWLAEGPEAAMTWADGLNRRVDRQTAQASVASELVKKDPENGFAWLAEHPELLKEFSSGDLSQALSEIQIAALEANQDTPFQALEWLTKAGADFPDYREPFLNEWFDREGVAQVAEKLLELPEGAVREFALGRAVKQWGLRDFEGAKDFVSGLAGSGSSTVEAVATELFRLLSPDQREGALSWVKTLPKDVQFDYVGQSARTLAVDHPDRITSFIEAVPEGSLRESALRQAVSNLDDAAIALIALPLLDQLPVEQHEELYWKISYRFTYQDPQAASEWLATLPDGRGKDRAIHQMIRALTYGHRNANIKDPEGAFHWAQVIGDETLRNEQLNIAVTVWRHADPQSARAAVEAAALEPAVKEKLLKRFEQ